MFDTSNQSIVCDLASNKAVSAIEQCNHNPSFKQLLQKTNELKQMYENMFGDYCYTNCLMCEKFLEHIPGSCHNYITQCPLCNEWLCQSCCPQIFLNVFNEETACDCPSITTIECHFCLHHYCVECQLESCYQCIEEEEEDDSSPRSNCPKCQKRFVIGDKLMCDCHHEIWEILNEF